MKAGGSQLTTHSASKSRWATSWPRHRDTMRLIAEATSITRRLGPVSMQSTSNVARDGKPISATKLREAIRI